jgi:hypothetical protein
MTTYAGGDIQILALRTLTPAKECLVPITCGAGWVQAPVLTLWRKEKSAIERRFLGLSARSLVTTPTEASRRKIRDE